ncbi:hypothetical protein PCE1_001429 [Barthelona sp. PCE]
MLENEALTAVSNETIQYGNPYIIFLPILAYFVLFLYSLLKVRRIKAYSRTYDSNNTATSLIKRWVFIFVAMGSLMRTISLFTDFTAVLNKDPVLHIEQALQDSSFFRLLPSLPFYISICLLEFIISDMVYGLRNLKSPKNIVKTSAFISIQFAQLILLEITRLTEDLPISFFPIKAHWVCGVFYVLVCISLLWSNIQLHRLSSSITQLRANVRPIITSVYATSFIYLCRGLVFLMSAMVKSDYLFINISLDLSMYYLLIEFLPTILLCFILRARRRRYGDQRNTSFKEHLLVQRK